MPSASRLLGLFLRRIEYFCRVPINQYSSSANFKLESRKLTEVFGEELTYFGIDAHDNFAHFQIAFSGSEFLIVLEESVEAIDHSGSRRSKSLGLS